MTSVRKAILAILTVLCAALIVVSAVLSWNYYDTNDYERQILLGKRYYAAGEYDNAMARFQRAIHLEPGREDGYVGLSQIYTVRGDSVMAGNILLIGSERSGNESLRYMIEGIIGEHTIEYAVADITPELNMNILRLLTTSTYNEYRIKNSGISTSAAEDGSCTVRVNTPSAELTFAATDVDRITGTPHSNSVPQFASMENITELFGDAQKVTTEDLEAMGASEINVYDNKSGGKTVSFILKNCEFAISCDEEGTFSSYAGNRIKLPEVSKTSDENEDENEDEACAVTGTVINAVTGNGVSNATLSFISLDSGTGESVSTSTDGFGIYSVTLAEGQYRVEIVCNGFTSEEFELRVDPVSDMTVAPFVISPILQEGQIRIVLEWGEHPRDLDSYLQGTLDSGESVYTYYEKPSSRNGERLLVELDVDDVNGYGPETTTIYDIDGIFTFWVEDFTKSGTMSDSGAVVKIYTPGSDSPVVIDICAGCENGWTVCEIDHGEVRVINQP